MSTSPRLRLLPGLTPVVREPGVLQVGLDPPRRALVADLPGVRRLLAALTVGGPVDLAAAPVMAALASLDAAGLLCRSADGDVDPALLARHGDAGAARPARGARVELDAPARLRPDLLGLLAAAGLAPADPATGSVAAGSDGGVVALVVADRHLSRDRVDRWVRDEVPHLCVEARDGGFRVGPLVVPGATACLRCVDAAEGETDPRRALVLERLAERGDPAPYDRVGWSLASAWAVRDLRLLLDGERPATWSATLDLDTADGPVAPTPRVWARHACCGCGWDLLARA